VAAFCLAFTYGATRELIEQQIREAQLAAVKAVLPNVPSEGIRPLELPEAFRQGNKDVETIFEGLLDGAPVGHAIQVRSRGYGGPVVVMVGVGPGGEILEVRVVEHRETPGLGTYIEEEWFRKQFRGKTAAATLAINRDIDGRTGATISGKAVTRAVKAAMAAKAAFWEAGS
jgi:electron transport complex protein RnfG